MNKKGFTLVELLVVVTILSILASLGAVYFFKNFETSRDAVRVSDITNITKVLDLYRTDTGKYPSPDNSVDITYSGSLVWSQGEFGESVSRDLRSFGSEVFNDPRYDTFFSYSVTNNNKEYQIASIYEELEDDSRLALIPEAHAVIESALVTGDFNSFMVRAQSGNTYHYIATPSIIASDLSSTDVIDIISGQKLVYDKFFNLPSSYGSFVDTNGGFDFNVSDPLVFSGTNEELKTQSGIEQFVDNLQYVYSRTPTESFDLYANFLQDEGHSRLKDFLTKTYRIIFSHAFSCQDLYHQGVVNQDGFYEIDVDGSGPLLESTVFCDVRNDGTAWTRLGENYLGENGGNFSSGEHISTNYYTLYESSSDNTIVSISSPVSSGYALKQSGDTESNYEVHFDDFSQVQSGYDIRMSLWVTDNDGTWTNTLGLNPEAGYMFHNRLYYTDGTFSTNGESQLVASENVGGKVWKKFELIHRVRKEAQSFSWFIGLDSEDTRDLYFTGVELELYYR